MRRYRVPGGAINVFFRSPGLSGRITSKSRAYIIDTRSPVFTVAGLSTRTPFAQAAAVLGPLG
jgi:hypothetical protein